MWPDYFLPSKPHFFKYIGHANMYLLSCKYWDREARVNSTAPDQTAHTEQYVQDLQCMPFDLHLWNTFFAIIIKLFQERRRGRVVRAARIQYRKSP